MNIFTKAAIISILDKKIESKEIRGYTLSENSLHILKSKRSKHTIDTSILDDKFLLKMLSRKIPDVSKVGVADYFKREIRNVKLNAIL